MIERALIKQIDKELRPQKIMLVYGARRVGKTVLTEQIVSRSKMPSLILNGEDADTAALLANRSTESFRQLFGNFLISERIKRSHNAGVEAQYYFWRTYSGQEIDLIEECNHELHAFEFKWDERRPQVPSAFSNAHPDASYEVINRTNYLPFCL